MKKCENAIQQERDDFVICYYWFTTCYYLFTTMNHHNSQTNNKKSPRHTVSYGFPGFPGPPGVPCPLGYVLGVLFRVRVIEKVGGSWRKFEKVRESWRKLETVR